MSLGETCLELNDFNGEGCSDMEVEAAKSKHRVRQADDALVRKSILEDSEVFQEMNTPFELEKARRSAPQWATGRWSSFTTEMAPISSISGTIHMPGLRGSDEVDIEYLRSTIFTRDYVNLQLLGRGSYGAVCLCREKKTNRIVAVKAIKLVDKNNNSFLKELAVTRRLKHENIVQLHAAFRDQDVFYFVMENLSGGSVHLVLKRNPQGIPSVLASEWAFSLLSPVRYLHHHRICHRDIKAENVLLKKMGEDHPIKLVDFGLATRFKRGEKLKEAVGTPYSMAPEVVKRLPYNETADVWSVGCVVFELCTGHAPYVAKDRQNLLFKIRTRTVTFYTDEWNRHPKELQLVVNEMLNRNQDRRKHAHEILQEFPIFSSSVGFDTLGFGKDCLDPDESVRSRNPTCCCVT